MRKKSHFILAVFIADRLQASRFHDLNLQQHRTAFIVGSLVPDYKLSFLVSKHSYDNKSARIEEQIRKLTDDYLPGPPPNTRYWLKLGEVIHFIADFFTFPHNTNFDGNIKEHCSIEGELKRTLKRRIRKGEADAFCYEDIRFDNTEELIHFIRHTHDEYLKKPRSVDDDIGYIASVTYIVTLGVIELITPKVTQEGRRPRKMNPKAGT